MKSRNGLVSNSSSSSFQIALDDLTRKQERALLRYSEDVKALLRPWGGDECDSWDVWTNEDTIVKGRDDWHWEDDYED